MVFCCLFVVFFSFLGTNRFPYAYFKACACHANHYRLDRFGPCFRCPKYGKCISEALYFKSGYYWNWNNSQVSENYYQQFINNLKITDGEYDPQAAALRFSLPLPNPCPNPAACLALNGSLSFRCLVGYQGFLCAGCERGYQKTGFICNPCPGKTTRIIVICVVAVLTFCLGAAIVLTVTRPSDKNSGYLDVILSNGKICINFFYITSKLYKALSFVQWPNIIKDVSKYVNIVSFDPISVMAVECFAGEFDVYSKFKVYMVTNATVIAVSLLVISLLQMCLYRKIKQHTYSTVQVSAARKSLIGVISMVIFLLYPSTASSVFGVLPLACKKYYLTQNKELSADYFLENPSIRCFTNIHDKSLALGYLSLVYVLGVPIVIPLVLYFTANRKKNNNSSAMNQKEYKGQLQVDVLELQEISSESFSSVRRPVKLRQDNLDHHSQGRDLAAFSDKDKLRMRDTANNKLSISTSGQLMNNNASQSLRGNAGTSSDVQQAVSLRKDIYDGLCFYYANYKDAFFFWESVEMLRKVLLSSVTVFIGGSSRTSVALLVMFSGLFAVLHAQFKPIKRKIEHALQLLALFAIFCNLVIGLSIKLPSEMEESTTKRDSLALTVALLICNGWIIISGITLTLGK